MRSKQDDPRCPKCHYNRWGVSKDGDIKCLHCGYKVVYGNR